MDAKKLSDDPDFRQLVRNIERLSRYASPSTVSMATATAKQDKQASLEELNKLEKEFQTLQEELARLPDELTSQHEQKLMSLQERAGQQLGLTRKEFSLLMSDLSTRSAKLMEKNPTLADIVDRETLLANAAKPVLLNSMSVSPLAFASIDSDVEEVLSARALTTQENCQALCTTDYIAAEAAAAGIYVGASAGCLALSPTPAVGAALAAACVGAASVVYVAAHVQASTAYSRCFEAC